MLQVRRTMTMPKIRDQIQAPEIICDKTEDGRFIITITTTDESLVMTLECLRLLMGVSERVYNTMDRVQSRENGLQKVKVWKEHAKLETKTHKEVSYDSSQCQIE